MSSSAEERRRRLGNISAGLTGASPRKRAADILPDLVEESPRTMAEKTVTEPESTVAAPPGVPAETKPVPPAPSKPLAPPLVQPTPEPVAAKAERLVMNLPTAAAETLRRGRGVVGRTHADVVFFVIEQAISENRLESLVRDYEHRGSSGMYFQSHGGARGGAVEQVAPRLSPENRNALDKLVEQFGASSRTALVAAALLGARI